MAKIGSTIPALGAVPTGDTKSRLSYPMMMALLGATQGATNTGSDWVELGNGFRAYDSSPKRALMGLIQGGSQGYMGGVLQQRQLEAQQANDAARRKLDNDEWARRLGLQTDAAIEKENVKGENDFATKSNLMTLKAMIDNSPEATDAAAMKKYGVPAKELASRMERELKLKEASAGLAERRMSLEEITAGEKSADALLQQPIKDAKTQAETDLVKARADALRNPKAKAVNQAQARFRALMDTIKIDPTFNPTGYNRPSSMAIYNKRLLFHGGAVGEADAGISQPTEMPLSDLFN